MKLKALIVEIESIEYIRVFKEYSDKKRTSAEINAAILSIAEEITNNTPVLMLKEATQAARKDLETIFTGEEIDRNNLMGIDSIKNNINHYRFWEIEETIRENYKII